MAWKPGSGDEGYTRLLGGERTAKESPRIEALGALDEATSAIGIARAFCARPDTGAVLARAQSHLCRLMAEVAATEPERLAARIDAGAVRDLEQEIAALDDAMAAGFAFVLPGDSRAGAMLDLARAVVRRAERRLAGLQHQGVVDNTHLLAYVNRLSTLLYRLARTEDIAAGVVTPTTP